MQAMATPAGMPWTRAATTGLSEPPSNDGASGNDGESIAPRERNDSGGSNGESLAQFLVDARLDCYHDVLRQQGFSDVSSLRRFVASSPDAMRQLVEKTGLKPGHQMKLRIALGRVPSGGNGDGDSDDENSDAAVGVVDSDEEQEQQDRKYGMGSRRLPAPSLGMQTATAGGVTSAATVRAPGIGAALQLKQHQRSTAVPGLSAHAISFQPRSGSGNIVPQGVGGTGSHCAGSFFSLDLPDVGRLVQQDQQSRRSFTQQQQQLQRPPVHLRQHLHSGTAQHPRTPELISSNPGSFSGAAAGEMGTAGGAPGFGYGVFSSLPPASIAAASEAVAGRQRCSSSVVEPPARQHRPGSDTGPANIGGTDGDDYVSGDAFSALESMGESLVSSLLFDDDASPQNLTKGSRSVDVKDMPISSFSFGSDQLCAGGDAIIGGHRSSTLPPTSVSAADIGWQSSQTRVLIMEGCENDPSEAQGMVPREKLKQAVSLQRNQNAQEKQQSQPPLTAASIVAARSSLSSQQRQQLQQRQRGTHGEISGSSVQHQRGGRRVPQPSGNKGRPAQQRGLPQALSEDFFPALSVSAASTKVTQTNAGGNESVKTGPSKKSRDGHRGGKQTDADRGSVMSTRSVVAAAVGAKSTRAASSVSKRSAAPARSGPRSSEEKVSLSRAALGDSSSRQLQQKGHGSVGAGGHNGQHAAPFQGPGSIQGLFESFGAVGSPRVVLKQRKRPQSRHHKEAAPLTSAPDPLMDKAKGVGQAHSGKDGESKDRRKTMCQSGYLCKLRARCKSGHTADQLVFFKNPLAKAKKCTRNMGDVCDKQPGFCTYAHSVKDARCSWCHCRGHFVGDCAQAKRRRCTRKGGKVCDRDAIMCGFSHSEMDARCQRCGKRGHYSENCKNRGGA